jgi:hypothetical protein
MTRLDRRDGRARASLTRNIGNETDVTRAGRRSGPRETTPYFFV